MENPELASYRPPPPELTGGQRLAGMFLRLFGNLTMAMAWTGWIVVLLALFSSMFERDPSGSLLGYLKSAIIFVGALLFLIAGRLAHHTGLVLSGKGPRLSGRLIVKKLLYDLTFEITGFLVLPLFFGGLSLMLGQRLYGPGAGCIGLALLIGFGLPRLINAFVRKM